MSGTPYPRTVELLKREGIDPSLLTVNGINQNSYLQIVLDADGNKVLNENGNIAAVQRAWPRPGLGEEVMNAMIEDIRAKEPFQVKREDGDQAYPIDRVVLLRRRYDMDPTEENAKAWLDAENLLSPSEFDDYMDLYRKVATGGTSEAKSTEAENIEKE